MQIAELSNMLAEMWKSPTRKLVPYLQGAPGIGKTAIPQQVAKSLKLPVITFNLTSCESVDIRGLPQVVNGKTSWACPMPQEGRGVLILDELASAAPDVQVAAHHLIRSEEGSDVRVGEGWHIVVTGNRAKDKTYYRALGAPLRNRMVLVDVETSVPSVVNYLMDNGGNPLIGGFLRWRPEMLIAKEIPAEGPFPSPRAYEAVSEVLAMNVSGSVESELIQGSIGQGAATEFCAYLRTARELPQIEEIEANPTKVTVPSSPSLLYALTTSLAHYTRQTGKSMMEFMKRAPAEFTLLYVRDVRDSYDLRKDSHIRGWIADHKKLFVEA